MASVAVGCVNAALTLAQAWLVAHAIAGVFATRTLDGVGTAAAMLAAVFVGKAALGWAGDWLAQRASAAVKSQLRRDIVTARLARPLDAGAASGGLITLVTQGLDALDGYYAKYLPQLVLAVTVPLIIGVAILTADLTSAIIVALTLPLIPVFMALVGWTTEARTQKRWRVQTRLANHFADLVAGLPTLQVFGRARAQLEGLRRTQSAHRAETMATLRLSFLSALVLELLSTLSVALVAVTIGFRVVAGDLDLATALFVLVLAPEAYLPVRQVGAHYHDAADGTAAAASAFALIEGADQDGGSGHRPSPAPAPDRAGSASLVAVRDLGHTYPGADDPAVAGVTFDVTPGAFVVLTGPSGGGKTTVLNALLGFLEPTAGSVLVDGHRLDATTLPAWRRRVAYVGQNPGMVNGDVAGNVRLGFPAATDDQVRDALRDAGAPELAPDHSVGDDGEGLSSGERRRVATARALLRIRLGGADVLLLDEPTAGLDSGAEIALLDTLRSSGVTAVVVSHRRRVIERADAVVRIEPADPREDVR
ncbi:thiol reductant ABC exporter subunit CydD [Nigerium massiliense]|uniref:thiol reductant ABC exporter subunit CydD n=1 Tax=Nigerium massiliense TaxID=1522317 RepID=UPI00058EF0D7|nr:thiol reductant ABC exporter subunit CydD [Nigerium massiliense]